MYDFKLVNYGWVCPKCGRVMSPNTPMCLVCPQLESNATTGTDRTEVKTLNPWEVSQTVGEDIEETNDQSLHKLYQQNSFKVGDSPLKRKDRT